MPTELSKTQTSTKTPKEVLKVVLFGAPGKLFDYLPPQGTQHGAWCVGLRVRAPFRNGFAMGVVAELGEAQVAMHQIKRLILIDTVPLLNQSAMALLRFMRAYYHLAWRDVYRLFLAPDLMKHANILEHKDKFWRITQTGKEINLGTLSRAPKQQRTLGELQQFHTMPDGMRKALNLPLESLKALEKKGWVLLEHAPRTPEMPTKNPKLAPPLTALQTGVFETIKSPITSKKFSAHLLWGVTGSGKSYIYLHVLLHLFEAFKKNKTQVLLLVPEIGLVSSMVRFLYEFLDIKIVAYHSALSEQRRNEVHAWVRSESTIIIVGTRSALFLPFENLACIIVDEEHDTSYKSFTGVAYHARDCAMALASFAKIPIILASATPSLESIHNAELGKYQLHKLHQRATEGGAPSCVLVDMKNYPKDPFHPLVMDAVASSIEQGLHVLIFLNRRGYAPILYCKECTYDYPCPHCSVKLTYHKHKNTLVCHQCGFSTAKSKACPQCGKEDSALALGAGTQKLEESIQTRFKHTPIHVIDRDHFKPEDFDALQSHLSKDAGNKGKGHVLIGTQMSAKGHNFPSLFLVVIQNMDSALFSGNPYSSEHTAQMITQVSGRSGRGENQGKVMLQTLYPHHALMQKSLSLDYEHAAAHLLHERQAHDFAPFVRMAVLYIYAKNADNARIDAQSIMPALQSAEGVVAVGPMPSLVSKRQNFHYYQIVLKSSLASKLHGAIACAKAHSLSFAKSRLQVDIDPCEFY